MRDKPLIRHFGDLLFEDQLWIIDDSFRSSESKDLESILSRKEVESQIQKVVEAPEINIRSESNKVDLKLDSQWLDRISSRLSSDHRQRFQAKSGPVKAMVLSDSFKPSFDSEFTMCFEPKAAQLFEKMISAMSLQPSQFLLSSPFDHEGGDYECLIEEIMLFKPQLIISLGAKASQKVLGFSQRLAQVHGQFFERDFEFNDHVFKTSVMPLFHPELLLINPNMKKTAWSDMQKAMAFLGLNT